MSRSIKMMATLGLFVFAVACTNGQEEVVLEPVTSEPAYSGKLE